MATQNYPDVGTLEQASKYRTGVPTRLLNVLTGGLAGAITGSTEKAQEAARARQALLQEDLDKRTEQRMIERMKLQQAEMLKRQLELEAARTAAEERRQLLDVTGAEEVLTGADKTNIGPVEQAQELGRRKARVQKLATGEREASEKAQLIGRLSAEMGPTERAAIESGVMPNYSDLDINTLRRMGGASDASIRQRAEGRQAKQDEGRVFVSRSATGEVSVQGPADLVRKYQDANPDVFTKRKNSPYKISMRETEDGRSFNVDFGDMTTDEIQNIAPQLDQMKKAYGVSSQADLSGGGGAGAGAGASTAKPLPKGPAATPEEPMVGRGSGKSRAGAAAVIANEVAAQPDMYGPPTPGEQFRQTGRRLGALEGRGGASTYGAQETLTNPFYEAVASELGTQPERVGGESIIVKSAKAVIASQFPTEQWNNLPQERKNKIYIDALNKSAMQMANPPDPKSPFAVGYSESPFAAYSVKRD